WEMNKPNANRLHPTMKPVELIQIALNNSSKAGDIVLDLFGGSGSTLIACEMLGRTAYLMELDPRYCDVMINRWQDFTGQKAVLEFTPLPAARLKSSRKSALADEFHLPLAKSNCAK
ncbi:MAG: DNA methyltransferase, partial [Pseudomonadota bacterium]